MTQQTVWEMSLVSGPNKGDLLIKGIYMSQPLSFEIKCPPSRMAQRLTLILSGFNMMSAHHSNELWQIFGYLASPPAHFPEPLKNSEKMVYFVGNYDTQTRKGQISFFFYPYEPFRNAVTLEKIMAAESV